MHELDVGVAGFPDDIQVDLVRLEQVDALLPYRLVLPHRHPDVGVEEVDALDPLVNVAGDAQTRSALLRHPAGALDQARIGPQRVGRANPDVHAELAAGDHQRVAGVEAGVT